MFTVIFGPARISNRVVAACGLRTIIGATTVVKLAHLQLDSPLGLEHVRRAVQADVSRAIGVGIVVTAGTYSVAVEDQAPFGVQWQMGVRFGGRGLFVLRVIIADRRPRPGVGRGLLAAVLLGGTDVDLDRPHVWFAAK